MIRSLIALFCFIFLVAGSTFSQHGLGLALMSNNVLSQKYQPANILETKVSKVYYSLVLDSDSTYFKYAADFSGWAGSNQTTFDGVFGENGYIPVEVRERIAADLGNGGKFGGGLNLGYVNLNVKINERQFGFFLDENITGNVRLNNGKTAGLALLGNKPYLGETITDENIQANFQRTRSLGVGTGWDFLDNQKLKIGVRAKIYQGVQFNQLNDLDYSLFTEENGIRVDINSNFDYIQSDNDKAINMFTFQGIGAGADFGIIYEIDTGIQISASILDAGVMFWNAEQYQNDFEVSWEGLDIGSLIGGNLANTDSIIDSLTNIVLPDSSEISYIAPTGTRVSLAAEFDLNKKMKLGAQIWYSPLLNGPYTPLPILNVSYLCKLHSRFQIGVNAYGGGMEMYGFGAVANGNFHIKATRFDLTVGSDNLAGIVAPSFGRGFNVFAGIGVGM